MKCSSPVVALLLASSAWAIPSKKEVLRAEKAVQPRRPPGGRLRVVTIINKKTRETLPVPHDTFPTEDEASRLLRCHFTGERAWVVQRLLQTAVRAARYFNRPRIEVVSGYRSPKYNRILRKKGREVARKSFHRFGRALDFRVPGVGVRALRRYVSRLGRFGIGIYPGSGFIHIDDGPWRRWGGK